MGDVRIHCAKTIFFYESMDVLTFLSAGGVVHAQPPTRYTVRYEGTPLPLDTGWSRP